MLIDWLFSKLGMFLLVLLFLEVLSASYSTYDTYNIQREADALVKEAADNIADVARAAPQYSVAVGHSKLISLPERVHGMLYLLRVDVDEYLVEVVVIGGNGDEEVSARAFLPIAGIGEPLFTGFEKSSSGGHEILVDRPLKIGVAKTTEGLAISVVKG